MTKVHAAVNISNANRDVSGENKFAWQADFYPSHISNTLSVHV